MLRIKTIGAGMIALTASAGMALAADLPRYQAPPPAAAYTPTSAYDWTGPYLGLTGGYGWSGTNGNGWLGGAYVGYNFQLAPNWVAGIEGDFTFTGKSASNGVSTFSNPWNSTIRGRLGYAYDRFMFYGTGGIAFGSQKAVTGPTTEETTKVGWTGGLGMEAALTNNVTGRVEWRYTDLGSNTFPTAGAVSTTSSDLMVGIGVKF